MWICQNGMSSSCRRLVQSYTREYRAGKLVSILRSRVSPFHPASTPKQFEYAWRHRNVVLERQTSLDPRSSHKQMIGRSCCWIGQWKNQQQFPWLQILSTGKLRRGNFQSYCIFILTTGIQCNFTMCYSHNVKCFIICARRQMRCSLKVDQYIGLYCRLFHRL